MLINNFVVAPINLQVQELENAPNHQHHQACSSENKSEKKMTKKNCFYNDSHILSIVYKSL